MIISSFENLNNQEKNSNLKRRMAQQPGSRALILATSGESLTETTWAPQNRLLQEPAASQKLYC